jgi:hypothetical protein
MATTTNYSWSTPDDTALVKDGAAAIRTLGSSADTTVKALNPGTTAGDIDYYTTSTAKARIGIGTAGQVLAVNSGATAPEWITSSSGGMTLLSTTTLSGATTTISGISGSYNDLQIIIKGVTGSSENNHLRLSINNNANAWEMLGLQNATTNWDATINLTGAQSMTYTNADNSFCVRLHDYANSARYKPMSIFGGFNGSVSGDIPTMGGGYFKSNTAITSLVFTMPGNTFSTGTVLLYGVK